MSFSCYSKCKEQLFSFHLQQDMPEGTNELWSYVICDSRSKVYGNQQMGRFIDLIELV